MLKEYEMRASQWPIKQVEEVYPGEDGQVRVVTVRISKGLFKRPIQKLTILTHTD